MSAASALLSAMFSIYKDAVLFPRALVPPGVPSPEGMTKEEADLDASLLPETACCKAVSRWQAIRRAAEQNAWPFYVGIQGGEPIQFALATSIESHHEGQGNSKEALGSPLPLLDLLSNNKAVGLQSKAMPMNPLNKHPMEIPIAAPGSVSAALGVTAAETQLLLSAARNEAEQKKIIAALEAGAVSSSLCKFSTYSKDTTQLCESSYTHYPQFPLCSVAGKLPAKKVKSTLAASRLPKLASAALG